MWIREAEDLASLQHRKEVCRLRALLVSAYVHSFYGRWTRKDRLCIIVCASLLIGVLAPTSALESCRNSIIYTV